jgi:cellulose synthase (UDP-forming)
VDDPPFPADPSVLDKLERTRALADEIVVALRAPCERAERSYALARRRLARRPVTLSDVAGLKADYIEAAEWLERFAAAEQVNDHMAEFFVEQVVMALASELRLVVVALSGAIDQEEVVPAERMLQLHRRLVWVFRARATNFERKRYASLSQEANKAMNINSYLGLMGGVWRPVETAAGVELKRVKGSETVDGDLDIPWTDYVLTLDADSQLLRDYCLRLVYHLEQPENSEVAIAQTPYSSFRGAPTRIERIAGATTDIQHILHQGMTFHGATFWVGANAVIRRVALEDIVHVETVGGHEIRTYIQDRTVIEDTESSVDLVAAGWGLVNYPERLSYSATPPDFGSLVVQRRRWANGGLLILPRFWGQRRGRRLAGRPVGIGELTQRVNYMASIAWASLGLIVMLFYPYNGRLLSPLVVGAALPYFTAMAFDLHACGHRYLDVFRIYGFNIVLLPVNMAGVLKSIQQSLTAEKIPFARTPKVRNRTASPGLYVTVPYLIVLYSIFTAWRSWEHHNWGNFAFAVFNATLAAGAIRAYIGLRNSLVDMVMGLLNWIFVPKRRAPEPEAAPAGPGPTDWRGILYYGDRRLNRDLRGRDDRRRRAVRRPTRGGRRAKKRGQ